MRRRGPAASALLSSVVVAGVVLHGPAASAAVRDGNALLKQCSATIGALMTFCFGYIDAVTDAVLENDGLGNVDVCISAELDDVQLKNIVIGFLKKNPGLRRFAAPTLIARALAEAFPCR